MVFYLLHSTSRFNLSGLYTNRSSGISNDSGVSVRAASEKKTLVVELKKRSSGAQRKPITATSIVKFTGGPRRVVQKAIQRLGWISIYV